MNSPGVYIFKRKDEPLYVGCTSDLSQRPMKRDKGHQNRWSAIMEATSTELIPCESLVKAQQLEEQLIRANHPFYNLRVPCAQADFRANLADYQRELVKNACELMSLTSPKVCQI